MPMLMERKDWIRTVANVSRGDNVWYEDVSADTVDFPIRFPKVGRYQVILVNIDEPQESKPRRRSAREMIGCCRKYHPEYQSTEEIMKELREGEDD